MRLPRHTFIKARGETRHTWFGGKRRAVTVVEATCTPPNMPGQPVTITLYPCAATWLTRGLSGIMMGTCNYCGRAITNRDIADWAPIPLVTS